MLELNKLYNMDCMEGMARFPDKYFELAIVDPPYGIGNDAKFGVGSKQNDRWPLKTTRAFDDTKPPDAEYFSELFRVSKNQIIWGANHFISRIPYDSPCWIVWDKLKDAKSFADCELAWTSFKSAVRKFTFLWNGYFQGRGILQGCMAQGNHKNKEHKIHPTQKPVALYTWLLSHYAKPGDKILDTHAGSASSFIAAWEAGHDYIGFEIDPEYYAAACERTSAAMAQMRICDYE